MSYQQQLNDAAKRCHVGSYAVGANRICAEADATIAAKDADIASLRDRLRDTAQILIAEVGATGPADAEEVARKAVSQIARLREALGTFMEWWDTESAGPQYSSPLGRDGFDGEREWRAWWDNQLRLAALAPELGRAALAQVAEVGK